MANHVLGDGGLGNGNAKLRELAVHARRSPERLGSTHVPDQLAYFWGHARTTRPPSPTLPRPVASRAGTMPTHHGVRFNDHEYLRPVSPDSPQKHPESAVHTREPQPFHGMMEDGELLPEGQVLESQRAARFRTDG